MFKFEIGEKVRAAGTNGKPMVVLNRFQINTVPSNKLRNVYEVKFLDSPFDPERRAEESLEKFPGADSATDTNVGTKESKSSRSSIEPCIKDSGERTEYKTGAVRDCKEGKGRCDLMPLDVVARIPEHRSSKYIDTVISSIAKFQKDGDTDNLISAILSFSSEAYGNEYEMFLEVAKHFEQGAKKYGECNWQKGIPVHSYIDSAVRHYLKYKSGWEDERHDRAFVWNLLCCIWTVENKPEMDDFTRKESDNK